MTVREGDGRFAGTALLMLLLSGGRRLLLDLHDMPICTEFTKQRLKRVDAILLKSHFQKDALPSVVRGPCAAVSAPARSAHPSGLFGICSGHRPLRSNLIVASHARAAGSAETVRCDSEWG